VQYLVEPRTACPTECRAVRCLQCRANGLCAGHVVVGQSLSRDCQFQWNAAGCRCRYGDDYGNEWCCHGERVDHCGQCDEYVDRVGVVVLVGAGELEWWCATLGE